MHRILLILTLLALIPTQVRAAELILPQNRTAFYCRERIEFAVAGLKEGEKAVLELQPADKKLGTVSHTFTGTGGTVIVEAPGFAFAPSEYSLSLDGKPAGKLVISLGVTTSPLYLSQTVSDPRKAGGNFFLGNAFGFGLLDPTGLPRLQIRGQRSPGFQVFDNAIARDLPTLVYMYWTGYVTHKPFGSEKSWAAADMMEATRLLSLHTAQRLRRYQENILLVGTLDEPGLSWGKTPAGGMASGFPNWDEEAWYATRGWKYTQNPAERDAADWMKYMTIRCAIMKEMNERAKIDLREVWSGVKFSTDLYAAHAIMDGTDPLNQQVNDVPSSHVFLDWGIARSGALSSLYLEKCHDPTAPIAHAMNGQLFAAPVPQPQQSHAYRVTLNSMLAGGLYSNWWLNPTGMKEEDLARINEPALRLGALFKEFAPRQHDTAVLWGFTEMAMRQKAIAAREATKKTGEQIKLLIATLPDVPGAKGKEVNANAYDVGGNYAEQVLTTHQALTRAGYPSHILHERVLKDRLAAYKTLVVVGQTFALPEDVRKTIDDWAKKGGKVVVDSTTTQKFADAIRTEADIRDPGYRWRAFFHAAEKKDHPFKNNREASIYHTNHFMAELVRKAVPVIKTALRKTASQPAIETASVDLIAEKHVAADSSLYMVLNAHDKLPDIAPENRHALYNYAEHKATFTLKGILPGSVVYCIEGADWKSVRRVKDYDKPQTATFAPGEMKLFLVWPKEPSFWNGFPAIAPPKATLPGNQLPCPVTLRLSRKDGTELYRLDRCLKAGENDTTLSLPPFCDNHPDGTYTASVDSIIPEKGLKHERPLMHLPKKRAWRTIEDEVRVFDESMIRLFLKTRAALYIAHGDGNKAAAQKLAEGLAKQGIQGLLKRDGEVLRKVAYPRVWNPFADVYAFDAAKVMPKDVVVKTHIDLTTDKDGKTKARTRDGKDVSSDWRQPEALVTIRGEGYVDYSGDREKCYQPGVQLYFDKGRNLRVVNASSREAKTTREFRATWAKPWERLTSHQGAYQLPPQLPEAYTTDAHLIVLGDSQSNSVARAIQASELLTQTADGKYPGPGRALLQFAWSPFALDSNVIHVGASDAGGLDAGCLRLLALGPGPVAGK